MSDREAFEAWADQKFGSGFVKEDMLTYFRMSAAFEAATLAERERCAKVCEKLRTVSPAPGHDFDDVERGFNAATRRCADVIRQEPAP